MFFKKQLSPAFWFPAPNTDSAVYGCNYAGTAPRLAPHITVQVCSAAGNGFYLCEVTAVVEEVSLSTPRPSVPTVALSRLPALLVFNTG